MGFPQAMHISECFIKPKCDMEELKLPRHHYLSPFDLIFLASNYGQLGLFYTKPKRGFSIQKLLESLKDSLALTLIHFYPLAGQLATLIDEEHNKCLVFVDCNRGPGARFVHAALDMTMSDILSQTCVLAEEKSLYDHNKWEANYDGHTRPLLSVQVTELLDAMFVSVSMNHAVVDGASLVHFWNVWSEVHRGNGINRMSMSPPPLHKCWLPDGFGVSDLKLPFTNPDKFIPRYEPPQLRERYFHFSSETMAILKAEANKECNKTHKEISAFQALAAFVWRCIIRAKGLGPDEVTYCKLASNSRHRLHPPLHQDHFGNSVVTIKVTTTVGELLGHNLGWVASLLHESVTKKNSDKALQDFIQEWFRSPFFSLTNAISDSDANRTLYFAGSTQFNAYGNEFAGLGKPLAARTGFANKFDGKIFAIQGSEGGGSVDLNISLAPDSMSALESDEEFMSVVTSSYSGLFRSNSLLSCL